MSVHLSDRQTDGFVSYGPRQIRDAVGFEDVVEPVGRALADFSCGQGDSPVAVFAPAGSEGDVHVKSAWLPGRSIFTVKVATWFLARSHQGKPPGAGVVAAFDAGTGDLLALLEDEHHLSDIRTAAAGAIAARHLARADAATLGVIGTGVQAYLQTLAATSERPIGTVRLWGRNPDRARRLADAIRTRRPDLRVVLAPSPQAVCEGADLLVTATSSTTALVQADWLSPGVHITAVGADDAGKCELDAQVLARADRLVVDSRALSARYGDVARAVAAGVIGLDRVDAELGELVAGSAAGRTDDRQITVCKLIGLGVQDLAAAEVALDRLGSADRRSDRPASATDLLEDSDR